MQKDSLVLGAFITDDFYFAFEEKGIKVLEKSNTITGRFVCHDNKGDGKLLPMKLIVNVVEINEDCLSSKISISFEEKIAHFNIIKEDFINWFIEVDEFTFDNGPSFRDASSNVYITRGDSRKYLNCKNEILYLMQQAD